MATCKPVNTPMCVQNHLMDARPSQSTGYADPNLYREMIGSLLYLSTKTRQDISAGVAILARRVSKPTSENMVAVKRIFRYLRGTSDFCLNITCQSLELTVYSDSDWGGDYTDRKSTTGYVLLLGGAAISWRTLKKKLFALSSTEAEFNRGFDQLSRSGLDQSTVRRIRYSTEGTYSFVAR